MYEVVDGKQRLTAMWKFMAGDFTTPRGLALPGIGNVGNMRFDELPTAARDRFQFSKITISELEEATDEEVAELFLRLQKGEPLRAAEKRNAVLGPVRDFVAGELASLSVFKKLGIPNRRFAWHELAAIALQLEHEGGATSLKGADLNELYEDASFDRTGPVAINTKRLLGDLEKVATERPGLIATRWGYVDLLLAIRELNETATLWDARTVADFYFAFEEERKEAMLRLAELWAQVAELDLSELQEAEARLALPTLAADMFNYVQAFSREGATAENVKTRSTVMSRRLHAALKR